MKFENKLALIPKKEADKYIKDIAFDSIKNKKVNETNVDSLVQDILVSKLSYRREDEVELAVTALRNSTIKIPSKTVAASGTGEIDCAIFIGNQLQVIIEDKEPNENVDVALKEAIYYADGLNSKGEDIRVAIGFNGQDILVRVRDIGSNKWVPFFINGKEVKSFVGKDLLQLIYAEKDIHGIKVKDIKDNINIQDIIGNLKTIYRATDLQNDNQKTIDFTIAFIGLRSVFEKYNNQYNLKTWKDLNNKPNPKDNSNSDDEDLRDNIINAIGRILSKIGDEYKDLFVNKDSEENEIFNFEKTLKTFKTTHHLECLRKIYIEISRLHDLHDSRIDLFGEVYESLGDKNTKKAFGQYFTRRHIIKSLITLMEVDLQTFVGDLEEKAQKGRVVYSAKSPKIICDPACGTGGFLTEFFKHIVSKAKDKEKYKEVDLSSLAPESFYGYDIYTSNVTRTKINMYLAGDGFSEIRKADTLQDENIRNSNNKFDYIITNPPYGKGAYTVKYPFEENTEGNGLQTVYKPVANNQRLEVNFLVKIIDMLKPTGKAMVIMPDGILEATTLSPLREWFLRTCKLEKVVSLPKHAFAPYTHEKTYAIFFEKRYEVLQDINEVLNDSAVWAYIVDNDGFANSDKRFRTDRMDENGKYLHDEFSQWVSTDGRLNDSLIIERFKKKEHPKDEQFLNEWGETIEGIKYGYIDMAEILEDEFISYPIVLTNNVLKKLNGAFESRVNLDKLFETEGLSPEQERVKNTMVVVLEREYGITYDSTDSCFIDKNKPVIKSLKNKELCDLINIEVGEGLKIKHPTELLNITGEDKVLKCEYVAALTALGLSYNLSKKMPKFWKITDVTFKKVPSKTLVTKIKKVFADNFLVKKIDQIIDIEKNEVKVEYEELLNNFGLEYDSYEKKFFDTNNKLIKKTLILTPEKYFRQEKVESISLDKIKDTNTKLIAELKDLLSSLPSDG